MEKGFKLNAAKEFFNILFNWEFVQFFGYRNKIQAPNEDGIPLNRKADDFLE